MNTTEFQLKIILKSDMCCGTGDGNGSSVDCLTAFDDVGLPFIPAKRLKGLLRKQAEFLSDYNAATKEEIERLFGSFEIVGEGRKDGAIRVNNAVLEDYETLHKELPAHATKDEVIDAYCSLRAQTAIDDEGVAKEGSLRITQVVKKGTVFVSEVSINNGDDEIKQLFRNCVSTLHHIGLNKTRGFGEAQCELTEKPARKIEGLKFENKGDKTTFEYSVSLLDDVVISAGSNVNCDYIKGTMVQGAFARYIKGFKEFESVYLRNVLFSNAYIEGFEPIPLSYVSVKNQDDKCYNIADGFEKEKKQYLSMEGYYQIKDEKFITGKVQTAEEYHYSTKTNDIFTFRKLLKGQFFKGTMTAPKSFIQTLKAVLAGRKNIILLGGSSSAQYARCVFEFGEEKKPEQVKVKETMVAELLTDVVVRDKYGAISSNYNDLIDSFEKLFNFDKNSVEVYIKFVTGGGFNSKWKLPIQQYTAFSKGSTLVFRGCTPKEDAGELSASGMFRDLTFGGYGEYKLRHVAEKNEYCVEEYNEASNQHTGGFSESTEETIKIVDENRAKSFVRAEAVRKANDEDLKASSQSAVMRVHSGFLINKSYESFKNFIEKKFAGKKNKELYDFAWRIINSYDELKNDELEKIKKSDKLFYEFTKAYLTQVKFRYQQGGDRQ